MSSLVFDTAVAVIAGVVAAFWIAQHIRTRRTFRRFMADLQKAADSARKAI